MRFPVSFLRLLSALSVTALLAVGPFTFASTFVGNGGGRGEIEREVTLQQLRQTVAQMQRLQSAPDSEKTENSTSSLCRCSEAFENHAMCAPLKALDSEQEKFCSTTLEAHLNDFAQLLRSEGSSGLPYAWKWEWTDSEISTLESGRSRASDAVANYDQRTITFDQRRFIEMSSFNRMFLVQHELAHLIAIDGQHLVDEGPIGPFTGNSGKRQLIDAMAAATVMRGVESRIDVQFRRQLNRAQGWRTNWIDLRGGVTATVPSNSDYAPSAITQTTLDYRHYFSGWGIVLGARHGWGEHTVLSNANATDERKSIHTGVSYRYFPNSNPLRYWGQTHFILNALVESVWGRYHLYDGYVGQVQSATTPGAVIEGSYTLPLFAGFWAQGGIGLEYAPIRYHLESSSQNSTTIQNNGIQPSIWLGVSYAF